MNSEEKKKTPPQIELTDDELEEISGGTKRGFTMCRCPTCNATTMSIVGELCIFCSGKGVKSYLVKA